LFANVALLLALAVLASFIYDIYNPQVSMNRESVEQHVIPPGSGNASVESSAYVLMQVNDTLQATIGMQGCEPRGTLNFTVVHVLSGEGASAALPFRESTASSPVFTAWRSGVYYVSVVVKLEGFSSGPCSLTVRYAISQSPKYAYLRSYEPLLAALVAALLGVNLYALLRR